MNIQDVVLSMRLQPLVTIFMRFTSAERVKFLECFCLKCGHPRRPGPCQRCDDLPPTQVTATLVRYCNDPET